MKYGAVIVETRLLPNLVEIIDRHLEHLPVNWGLRIYCSKDNIKLLNAMYGSAATIEISHINSASEYNNLMTSEWFYETCPFDVMLVFQHDSMLIRGNISNFVGYDYVGSPWKFQEKGGNGGLSIRNVSACLRLLMHTPYQESIHGNEDVYFSNHLANVAPREVCMQFACETIYQLGTTGYHAIEKWLSAAECDSIKQQYGYSQIRREYDRLCGTPSDINQHLPMLCALANRSKRVTEMGVRGVVSTFAFLEGKPNTLTSYDINPAPQDRLDFINRFCYQNTVFKFVCADVLKVEIEETDLWFCDTLHTYSQLKQELKLHAGKVKKWIALHDTTTFGYGDEPYEWQTDNIRNNYVVDEKKGLWPAVEEFLEENPEWEVLHRFEHNNGLTILQRINGGIN